MFKVASPITRAFTAALILGSLAVATPVLAQTGTGTTMTSPDTSSMQMAPASKKSSANEMSSQVETRIKTLHEKLKITADQESAWDNVAQAMRDNEQAMSQLIQERHENAKTMSAVDDLESYQKITQAHADGMTKLISAFQPLYADMSDDQKKNADEVFGRFEGHRGAMKTSMKKKSTAMPDTSNQ